MIDYKEVADAANMIINGYAFTKDDENIKVLKPDPKCQNSIDSS